MNLRHPWQWQRFGPLAAPHTRKTFLRRPDQLVIPRSCSKVELRPAWTPTVKEPGTCLVFAATDE